MSGCGLFEADVSTHEQLERLGRHMTTSLPLFVVQGAELTRLARLPDIVRTTYDDLDLEQGWDDNELTIGLVNWPAKELTRFDHPVRCVDELANVCDLAPPTHNPEDREQRIWSIHEDCCDCVLDPLITLAHRDTFSGLHAARTAPLAVDGGQDAQRDQERTEDHQECRERAQ